jgi:hypothetical protein
VVGGLVTRGPGVELKPPPTVPWRPSHSLGVTSTRTESELNNHNRNKSDDCQEQPGPSAGPPWNAAQTWSAESGVIQVHAFNQTNQSSDREASSEQVSGLDVSAPAGNSIAGQSHLPPGRIRQTVARSPERGFEPLTFCMAIEIREVRGRLTKSDGEPFTCTNRLGESR